MGHSKGMGEKPVKNLYDIERERDDILSQIQKKQQEIIDSVYNEHDLIMRNNRKGS